MDNSRVISLKNSFYKVCKVFLVLFPQVIIYKFKMSVFKDFKTNIVINVIYRYNVNSLSPLLLIFTDLLAGVRHAVYSVVYSR